MRLIESKAGLVAHPSLPRAERNYDAQVRQRTLKLARRHLSEPAMSRPVASSAWRNDGIASSPINSATVFGLRKTLTPEPPTPTDRGA